MIQRYLMVALGGAIGAMLRYFVGLVVADRFSQRFPVGTLGINLSACLMIGFIVEYLGRHGHAHTAWRYVFAIGFIGSFSTFSTFEWEAWADMTSGTFWQGILYIAVSVVVGLVAVAVGSMAARSMA
jgi:CrcB protein